MASNEKSNDVPELSSLKISEPTKSSKKKKAAPVADSWEDDMPSSSEDESLSETTKASERTAEVEDGTETRESQARSVVSTSSDVPDPYGFYNAPVATATSAVPEKRPEKSMAVVNRLIAGSLGIRVKRTEEQRQFEKNQIENEKKRRDEERKKRAEAENQKKSVWDD
jgi:hypothetical protein